MATIIYNANYKLPKITRNYLEWLKLSGMLKIGKITRNYLELLFV